MKKKLLMVGLGLISMAACQTKYSTITDTPTEDTVHTSKNSLDWAGKYQTTTPCADCPGIKTTVWLTSNDRFKAEYEYLEKNVKALDSGSFIWKNGNEIELKGATSREKFKVGENQLIQLDTEGKEITSAHKDYFVFKKQH